MYRRQLLKSIGSGFGLLITTRALGGSVWDPDEEGRCTPFVEDDSFMRIFFKAIAAALLVLAALAAAVGQFIGKHYVALGLTVINALRYVMGLTALASISLAQAGLYNALANDPPRPDYKFKVDVPWRDVNNHPHVALFHTELKPHLQAHADLASLLHAYLATWEKGLMAYQVGDIEWQHVHQADLDSLTPLLRHQCAEVAAMIPDLLSYIFLPQLDLNTTLNFSDDELIQLAKLELATRVWLDGVGEKVPDIARPASLTTMVSDYDGIELGEVRGLLTDAIKSITHGLRKQSSNRLWLFPSCQYNGKSQ